MSAMDVQMHAILLHRIDIDGYDVYILFYIFSHIQMLSGLSLCDRKKKKNNNKHLGVHLL